jgi:uncharacterized protein (TIGR04255 family)
MRIETFERVVYENNPLAEVVCQLRFERLEIGPSETAAIQAELVEAGYPHYGEEVSLAFMQQLGPIGQSAQAPVTFPPTKISHFTSADGVWRVSLCAEFVALTCLKYSGWDTFQPRLLGAAAVFLNKHLDAKPARLGLRYKDVIEREALGLDGVPWHQLIRPFLLGPLAPDALADQQTPSDEEVSTFLSQALLHLADAKVLLQSSLLTSVDGQRRAFLIDADFYNEGELESDLLRNDAALTKRLEALHANAGALFRRGITERLHRALRPIG